MPQVAPRLPNMLAIACRASISVSADRLLQAVADALEVKWPPGTMHYSTQCLCEGYALHSCLTGAAPGA